MRMFLLLVVSSMGFGATETITSQLKLTSIDQVFSGTTGSALELLLPRQWTRDDATKKDVRTAPFITYFQVTVGPKSIERGCRPEIDNEKRTVVLTREKNLESTKLVETLDCQEKNVDGVSTCYLFEVNANKGATVEGLAIGFKELSEEEGSVPCFFRVAYALSSPLPANDTVTPEELPPPPKPVNP